MPVTVGTPAVLNMMPTTARKDAEAFQTINCAMPFRNLPVNRQQKCTGISITAGLSILGK